MLRHLAILAAAVLIPALAASANAQAAAQKELPVAAVPSSILDFWRVLGPLVVGSYTGTCTDLYERSKVPATVTVDADGIVSTGALQADLRTAGMATLSRSRNAAGHYETSIDMSADGRFPAQLRLATSQTGIDNSTHFSGDKVMLLCKHTGAQAALTTALPYQSVAPLLDTTIQVMACSRDGKSAPRDVQVQLANDILVVGARSINLQAPLSESALFFNSGRDLTLRFEAADGSSVTAGYKGTGRLASLMVMQKARISQICAEKR